MNIVERILFIALLAFQVAIVGPVLSVLWEHVISLEQRTAWICQLQGPRAPGCPDWISK